VPSFKPQTVTQPGKWITECCKFSLEHAKNLLTQAGCTSTSPSSSAPCRLRQRAWHWQLERQSNAVSLHRSLLPARPAPKQTDPDRVLLLHFTCSKTSQFSNSALSCGPERRKKGQEFPEAGPEQKIGKKNVKINYKVGRKLMENTCVKLKIEEVAENFHEVSLSRTVSPKCFSTSQHRTWAALLAHPHALACYYCQGYYRGLAHSF